MSRIELVTYSDADMGLTEAIECDPEMMRELGGPMPRSEIPSIHKRRLKAVADGGWWFKIVPEPSGPAAGTIGIWESSWKGTAIHEIGWMVLTEFQGRGIASAALDELLARARSDPRFDAVHAFPGMSNGPSNALCRKFGFSLVEKCEYEYHGRPMKGNHWELEL